jgi:hypothetical protein
MSEASNQITHKLRVQHEGVLSTVAHAKPIAPLPVVEDLVCFLWACAEYQMQHSRARLQPAFSILLMILLGN